jgi:phenylacetate-CoA ligase
MPAFYRLYEGLPVALQNLAISLAGWRTRRRRFGRRFDELLRECEPRMNPGATGIGEHRDRRVQRYVQHCVDTVPFWRRRFADLGLDPRDIRGIDDLSALPVLDKTEVRSQRDQFFSERWPLRRCEPRGTGGTTGASLRFRASPDAVREQWAIWWRYWRWHGIPLHEPCGYFVGVDVVPSGSGSPYWRTNASRRQTMFSIFHLRPDTLPLYVEELKRRRVPWLHGYPSVLAILAGYLLEQGIDLRDQTRWVTTGAENLMPHQRELLQRAFGVRPRQHYGLAEGVANLSECPAGRLHVDEDFAAVEFVPRDDSTFGLVGTSLANPAFCLIRYDTGDRVALSDDQSCPCGRPGRLVDRIDGRREDMIVLPDGTRLGRLAHIFQHLDGIAEAQIVQDRGGAVVVKVVPVGRFEQADRDAVMAAARRRLGPDIPIAIERSESIPRSNSGKLRFVISEFDTPSTPTKGRSE